MSLSNTLIELRKQKGISQENFAALFGVSRQAVSKWETGESMPDIDKLEKISRYYGLTIDQLIHGEVSTGHTMDMLLLISTAINISVIIITSLWWHHSQDNWSILIGLLLLVISLTIYGYTKMHYGYTKISFNKYWIINIWLVPFVPSALFFNLLFYQMAAPYPLISANHLIFYGLYWIIYILVGSTMTLKMVKPLMKAKQK